MITPKNVLVQYLLLVMVLMAASWTKAEMSSVSSFQCGNPEGALEIPSTTTTTPPFLFDTIETDLKIDNWKDRNTQLLPGTIHWHIYAIDNGETPKYSCYPEGLVEPQISGSTLRLAPIKDRLDELGYHRGDKIQSSINLYIPLQQLRNIQVNGVGEVVEVMVTETLLTNVTTALPSIRIGASGVNSVLYVNASYSPIYFSASGVDTEATIAAGRNSTVDLSGVDQRVRIKSDHVNGKIRLSGITTRLILEGDYDSIDMSGVDCKVLVNGPTGCNSVHNSGINNDCRIPSSSDQVNNNTINITVPELDCLSTTTVVEGTCGISMGAVIGISIASLLVIALCIFGCIYKCRRGGRGRYPYQGQQEPPKDFSTSLQVPEGAPSTTTNTSTLSPAMTGYYDPQKEVEHVVEAEVIEIEPVPTPVTTTMDPEMAKGTDTKAFP